MTLSRGRLFLFVMLALGAAMTDRERERERELKPPSSFAQRKTACTAVQAVFVNGR